MENVLGYLTGKLDDGTPIRLFACLGKTTIRMKEGYITYDACVSIQTQDGSPVEKTVGSNRFKLVLTDQTGTCEGLDRI